MRAAAPEATARRLGVTLSRLGPEATALAHAAAVLGDGADLAHAAALAALDLDAAAAAAAALERAGVLARRAEVTFAQPIVRTAIYAQLGPGERGLAHRAAARTIFSSAAAERVAAHLLAAPAAGDAWAVGALELAADEARAPRRPGRRRAVPPARARRAARRAGPRRPPHPARSSGGGRRRPGRRSDPRPRRRGDRARPAPRRGPPRPRPRPRRRRVGGRRRSPPSPERGRRWRRRRRRSARPPGRSAGGRRSARRPPLRPRGGVGRGRSVGPGARRLPPPSGPRPSSRPPLAAQRASLARLVASEVERGRDRERTVAWALAAWGEPIGAEAAAALARAFLAAGAFDACREVCERGPASTELAVVRGALALAEGRLAEAVADLDPPEGWELRLPEVLALRAHVAGGAGRARRARRSRPAVEERLGGTRQWAHVHEARGRVALLADDLEGALPHFRAAGVRSGEAVALARLGRRDEAIARPRRRDRGAPRLGRAARPRPGAASPRHDPRPPGRRGPGRGGGAPRRLRRAARARERPHRPRRRPPRRAPPQRGRRGAAPRAGARGGVRGAPARGAHPGAARARPPPAAAARAA